MSLCHVRVRSREILLLAIVDIASGVLRNSAEERSELLLGVVRLLRALRDPVLCLLGVWVCLSAERGVALLVVLLRRIVVGVCHISCLRQLRRPEVVLLLPWRRSIASRLLMPRLVAASRVELGHDRLDLVVRHLEAREAEDVGLLALSQLQHVEQQEAHDAFADPHRRIADLDVLARPLQVSEHRSDAVARPVLDLFEERAVQTWQASEGALGPPCLERIEQRLEPVVLLEVGGGQLLDRRVSFASQVRPESRRGEEHLVLLQPGGVRLREPGVELEAHRSSGAVPCGHPVVDRLIVEEADDRGAGRHLWIAARLDTPQAAACLEVQPCGFATTTRDEYRSAASAGSSCACRT